MEMFELRYFNVTAETENILRASERLHVSSSAISKAINRLEDELGVDLFRKEGRNIKLTKEGRILLEKSAQILHMEKEAKLLVSAAKAEVEFKIAGPEAMLATFGITLLNHLKTAIPHASYSFESMSMIESVTALTEKRIDMYLGSSPHPSAYHKKLGKVKFNVVAGEKHPLYKRRSAIPIRELLKYEFMFFYFFGIFFKFKEIS